MRTRSLTPAFPPKDLDLKLGGLTPLSHTRQYAARIYFKKRKRKKHYQSLALVSGSLAMQEQLRQTGSSTRLSAARAVPVPSQHKWYTVPFRWPICALFPFISSPLWHACARAADGSVSAQCEGALVQHAQLHACHDRPGRVQPVHVCSAPASQGLPSGPVWQVSEQQHPALPTARHC